MSRWEKSLTTELAIHYSKRKKQYSFPWTLSRRSDIRERIHYLYTEWTELKIHGHARNLCEEGFSKGAGVMIQLNSKSERTTKNLNQWIGREHITYSRSISGENMTFRFGILKSQFGHRISRTSNFISRVTYRRECIKIVPRLSPDWRKLSTVKWQALVQKSQKPSSNVWKKWLRTVSNQEATTLKAVVYES